MKNGKPHDERDKIANFYPPGSLKNRFFAGYDQELKTGLMIGKQVSHSGVWKVLLFGFPGCGKSEFPFILVEKLKTELNLDFSLLYVKCHRLASYYDDVGQMKSHLKELKEKVEDFQPTILAFDEFDAISPRRTSISSSLTELSLWTMSFLANGSDIDSDKKMLVFGITNFPNLVDVAVRDRFQYPMFFGIANMNVVSAILEYNGIRNPKEVSMKLLELLTQAGQTVTGRGVALGCKALKQIESEILKKTDVPPEQMAKLLLIHAQPINTKEFNDYHSQNWGLIKQSKTVLDYWLEKFNNT